jgi:hypothetical protein
MEQNTILNELDHFTGTDGYHRWSILFKNMFLTDGAHHLAERAGAYWLMDIIGSYQPALLKKGEFFQVWHIYVNSDRSAQVYCDDGDGNIKVRQQIPYTDFPLADYKLYAQYDGDYVVIMLPSEY